MANDERMRQRIVRKFWSDYLGTAVARDGQVKGFREAWDSLSPEHRDIAKQYERAVMNKIRFDGRDEDECIASGVIAMRREFDGFPARRMSREHDGTAGPPAEDIAP